MAETYRDGQKHITAYNRLPQILFECFVVDFYNYENMEKIPNPYELIYEDLATIKKLIIDSLESTNTLIDSTNPEIINSKTLMERLDISEPTVIRWRDKGKIPYLQIGKAIRYDYAKVLAALEVNKKGGKIV